MDIQCDEWRGGFPRLRFVDEFGRPAFVGASEVAATNGDWCLFIGLEDGPAAFLSQSQLRVLLPHLAHFAEYGRLPAAVPA